MPLHHEPAHAQGLHAGDVGIFRQDVGSHGIGVAQHHAGNHEQQEAAENSQETHQIHDERIVKPVEACEQVGKFPLDAVDEVHGVGGSAQLQHAAQGDAHHQQHQTDAQDHGHGDAQRPGQELLQLLGHGEVHMPALDVQIEVEIEAGGIAASDHKSRHEVNQHRGDPVAPERLSCPRAMFVCFHEDPFLSFFYFITPSGGMQGRGF